ncbi:MAG: hypothetical protein ABI212_13060 [Burkholderiaceae bacterium]
MGREILSVLSIDERWSAVHAVGRRPPVVAYPKLTAHVVDLLALTALPPIDDVFIALGTTIKHAGSRAAFRRIDFDAVLSVARAARLAGATRLAVVSSMGANAASRVFYRRIKGEMEDAVAQLGFELTLIARPSMLSGNRSALEQAARPAERWTLGTMHWLRPLIPIDYAPITARQVALAMVDGIAAGASGRRVLLSGELQRSR